MSDPHVPRYTHGHDESVLRSHRWRTVANSAGYLIDHLRPGISLLDVGCGPGTITVDFARWLAPGTVTGVDCAELAIAEAAQLAATERVAVRYRVANVEDLPFADGSFDVVHAHQVLQHLTNPVAALVEMARVTAPGGLVAVRDGDYGAFSWYPNEPALERWREVYCAVARANGGDPFAGRHLAQWAASAGFQHVVTSTSTWRYATPAECRWWSELWADRITRTSLAHRAVELGVATRDELDELAAGWLRWGTSRDAWFTLPHGEILYRLAS